MEENEQELEGPRAAARAALLRLAASTYRQRYGISWTQSGVV